MGATEEWLALVRPVNILAKIIANHGVKIVKFDFADVTVAQFGDDLSIEVTDEEAKHLEQMQEDIG
jgi:hypothetical protein